MKKIYFLFAAAFCVSAAQAQTVNTADFEGLTYADDLDYETGQQLSGGFKSGNLYFVNTSSWVDYGEWGKFFTMGGFCYSKRTETTYDAATYTTDQFNNQIGAGAAGSEAFAVAYGTEPSSVTADYTFKPQSCYVTNNAYLLNSVMKGDAYARQFNYDDTFTLKITGFKDQVPTETVEVPLAAKGSVVFQWIPVDLTSLGEVDSVSFALTSTDTGDYGMNTPAYFCLDNLSVIFTETPTSISQTRAAASKSNQLYDLMGRRVDHPIPGVVYIK